MSTPNLHSNNLYFELHKINKSYDPSTMIIYNFKTPNLSYFTISVARRSKKKTLALRFCMLVANIISCSEVDLISKPCSLIFSFGQWFKKTSDHE